MAVCIETNAKTKIKDGEVTVDSLNANELRWLLLQPPTFARRLELDTRQIRSTFGNWGSKDGRTKRDIMNAYAQNIGLCSLPENSKHDVEVRTTPFTTTRDDDNRNPNTMPPLVEFTVTVYSAFGTKMSTMTLVYEPKTSDLVPAEGNSAEERRYEENDGARYWVRNRDNYVLRSVRAPKLLLPTQVEISRQETANILAEKFSVSAPSLLGDLQAARGLKNTSRNERNTEERQPRISYNEKSDANQMNEKLSSDFGKLKKELCRELNIPDSLQKNYELNIEYRSYYRKEETLITLTALSTQNLFGTNGLGQSSVRDTRRVSFTRHHKGQFADASNSNSPLADGDDGFRAEYSATQSKLQ